MLIEPGDLAQLGNVDLCIAGAGAAGLTLARSLSGGRLRVLLLESGSTTGDPATQSLYDTDVVGTPYPIEGSRLRLFGGTTNHWSGQSRPLDAVDFEPRSWVPHSGWPIRRTDLEPWLEEAHAICGLGPPAYDPSQWSETLGPDFLGGSSTLESKIFQLSSPIVRFAQAYGSEILDSPNVLVALRSNATEVIPVESGRQIVGLRVGTLDREETAIVRARAYVLACGAIENARLLLASDSVLAGGVGNENGNVGRFFMEHPAYAAGRILAGPLFPTPGLDWTPSAPADPPAVVIRAIGPNDDANRRHRLLRSMLLFYGRNADLPGENVSDVERAIRAGLWRDDVPPDRELTATSVFEQAPNPESRVRLSTERDALGGRKAVLDWRLGELDRDSLLRGTLLVGEELARLGLARTQLRPWVPRTDRPLRPGVGNHHMGTTRMSAEPREGVVDADCRVHGVDNLFVAGSGVFPTSGIANPTMNLVALALRLADHLERTVP